MLTKLGKNKGVERSRIWLEGDRLVKAGFTHKAEYVREWSDTGLVLRLAGPSDTGKVYKVAGKSDRPVIDTTGKAVVNAFSNASHVTATFYLGRIDITTPR